MKGESAKSIRPRNARFLKKVRIPAHAMTVHERPGAALPPP